MLLLLLLLLFELVFRRRSLSHSMSSHHFQHILGAHVLFIFAPHVQGRALCHRGAVRAGRRHQGRRLFGDPPAAVCGAVVMT